MGFLDFLGDLLSNSSDLVEANESPRFESAEEFTIYEQEQSGETWNGVPLSELSKLAQTVYRGRYVEVDEYGFLVFHYYSKSKKSFYRAQCELDENGHLRRRSASYYPNQWRDAADEFVYKANEDFFNL